MFWCERSAFLMKETREASGTKRFVAVWLGLRVCSSLWDVKGGWACFDRPAQGFVYVWLFEYSCVR